MCGIAGIYQLTTQATPEHQILSVMNDSQLHRGPDAGDYFYQPTVGLAHRRLSIIDIAGSPQPMQSADKQACIVFNGEIYNYRQLRQQLLDKGYQFNTNGDTETILNAWLEWGEDCVHHLRGMFAFAIWDAKRQCLFLARDRLGIKPLFYSLLDNGQFVFGSELKVLRQHPQFDKQLRDSTIEDFFSFGYVPEPYTIYQHSYKLSPGHSLLLQHGNASLPEPKQYWDLPTQWQQPLTEQQLSEGSRAIVFTRRSMEILQQIGADRAVTAQGLPWRFGVMDSTDVNAFALPGGTILITQGLYDRLRDEAELAAVLSHEIAHVVERHQVEAIKKEMGTAFATELAGEAAGHSDNQAVRMFGQKAFQAGTELFVRGLDKGDEHQADVHGMVISARGGYNPYALASVLHTLDGSAADDVGVALMFSTHPTAVSRIEHLETVVGDKLEAYAVNEAPARMVRPAQ